MREALQHQPRASAAHRYIFLALVLALSGSEFWMYLTSSRAGEPVSTETVAMAVLLTVSFMYAAFRPMVGGALVFAAGILEGFLWTEVALPSIFIYIMAADWISRRWYWPTFGFLGLVVSLTLVNQRDALHTFPTYITEVLVAVIAGLAMRRNGDRVERLEREAREAKEAAERAKQEIHDELAAHLHDTAVRDLVRLVSLIDSPISTEEEKENRDKMMGEAARDALRNIRATISPSQLPQEQRTLADSIAICVRMLMTRSITLTVNMHGDDNDTVLNEYRDLIELIVQEGTTNILKYAPAGSSARLLLESSPDEGVSVLLNNDIAQDESDLGPLSGGFGLHNLRSRVEAEGGELLSGPTGDSWVLIAQLPPVQPIVIPLDIPATLTAEKEEPHVTSDIIR